MPLPYDEFVPISEVPNSHHNLKGIVSKMRQAIEGNVAAVFELTISNMNGVRGTAYRLARETGHKARTRVKDGKLYVWFEKIEEAK